MNTSAAKVEQQGPFVAEIEQCEYSAKVEHPDRFELNSATAQIEQSNRRN